MGEDAGAVSVCVASVVRSYCHPDGIDGLYTIRTENGLACLWYFARYFTVGVHAIFGIYGTDSRFDCGALPGAGSFCILAGRSR